MLTIYLVLALVAFGCAIASAATANKVPLWVAVILLTILELLRTLPLGGGR
jgi:hypothetical protein